MPSRYVKHVLPGRAIDRRRLEVRVPLPQWAAIRQVANLQRISVNDLMVQMVDGYLAQHAKDRS